MNNIPPKKLWTPTDSWIRNSHLEDYRRWLTDHCGLHFTTYDDMWQWSISETSAFWRSIYDFFQVIDHGAPAYVRGDEPMPDTTWFAGSRVNYAEHIFRQATSAYPAILFQSEGSPVRAISWSQLNEQVTAVAGFLRSRGVVPGDRIVAFIPNIPEATIGFLAASAIGAVWSGCSPDFGSKGVLERFRQISPKVLLTVDGYRYGGRTFDRKETVMEMTGQLATLSLIIEIPFIQSERFLSGSVLWQEVVTFRAEALSFEPVPFDHPLWVLYSSGTTGQPKAIVHGHGGALLEHLKYIHFHNDVHIGERFFWYTTTGWMMWNYLQATLLAGATIVLYDGSPAYPDLDVLWQMAEKLSIRHFGTSAPYLMACEKQSLNPGQHYDLSALRSVSSTGAPLPKEGFEWVYSHVKTNVWLCSMSGGTDVCSAFVGGCPSEPVYAGEIQRRALGCAMQAWDDAGAEVINEVGEMVIVQPMPSMPLFFWNDSDKKRYIESYFEIYPGVWRHGDWLLITERNTLMIKGRSDATLNRQGIRIGTAEIYQSVQQLTEIRDSLIVDLQLKDGRNFMPLFVVLTPDTPWSEELIARINSRLRSDFTPRHVPDAVFVVPDIPYTISGKKLETPIKRLLMGAAPEQSVNMGTVKNPESLSFFLNLAKNL